MKALLHERTQAQVEAMLATRAGSYIFHGRRSVGKSTAAYEIAKRLNCNCPEPIAGTCRPCLQFGAATYPDLITIRPEDKPSILIEQIRALVQALSLSLYYSNGVRVVIIDDAHQMTPEAQNALLKLIEEPPAQTMFILVAERVEALLTTVRSRCVPVYFAKPTEQALASLLEREYALKPAEAVRIASVSEGTPGTAIMLATAPAEAQARIELATMATGAVALSRFERLLLAKQLADAKADLIRFGQILHTQATQALTAGSLDSSLASTRLQALEHFRQQLQAKVAPRVAVERLMLEL